MICVVCRYIELKLLFEAAIKSTYALEQHNSQHSAVLAVCEIDPALVIPR